ncbi:MAG: divalent-cation tolerance protein CutA [Parvularculaceae bacterium]
MSSSELRILYVTAPDLETAERIGRVLVEERLAACVNVLPEMRSVFRWRGEIEVDDETVMLVKTTAAAANRTRDRILALHPYETACVVDLGVSSEGSNPAFIEWAAGETS